MLCFYGSWRQKNRNVWSIFTTSRFHDASILAQKQTITLVMTSESNLYTCLMWHVCFKLEAVYVSNLWVLSQMIWKDIKFLLPEMQIGKEVITCYDCSAMQIDSHTSTFLPKASVEIGPTSKSKAKYPISNTSAKRNLYGSSSLGAWWSWCKHQNKLDFPQDRSKWVENTLRKCCDVIFYNYMISIWYDTD